LNEFREITSRSLDIRENSLNSLNSIAELRSYAKVRVVVVVVVVVVVEEEEEELLDCCLKALHVSR